MLNKSEIKVSSRWTDGNILVWVFSYGKLSHEISDMSLMRWLRTDDSGLRLHDRPHDGALRKLHSDAYIEKVLLPVVSAVEQSE